MMRWRTQLPHLLLFAECAEGISKRIDKQKKTPLALVRLHPPLEAQQESSRPAHCTSTPATAVST